MEENQQQQTTAPAANQTPAKERKKAKTDPRKRDWKVLVAFNKAEYERLVKRGLTTRGGTASVCHSLCTGTPLPPERMPLFDQKTFQYVEVVGAQLHTLIKRVSGVIRFHETGEGEKELEATLKEAKQLVFKLQSAIAKGGK